MNRIEIIVLSLIGIVLFYIIVPKNNNKIKEEEFNSEISAIAAWKDTHEKWDGTDGDILKIKYIVENKNTKLWVRDMGGKIIHETPFTMNPYPKESNKPTRVNSYIWRLYDGEHGNKYVPPGNYEIIVGTHLNSSNNYYLDIEI